MITGLILDAIASCYPAIMTTGSPSKQVIIVYVSSGFLTSLVVQQPVKGFAYQLNFIAKH